MAVGDGVPKTAAFRVHRRPILAMNGLNPQIDLLHCARFTIFGEIEASLA